MGSRRLRNELDRLLDRPADEQAGPAGNLAPLLHPARVARTALVAVVPADVAGRHVAALQADRRRNVVVAPRLRRPTGLRVVAASLVAGILLVLGAGGAVAASANTLPGDSLYGVKRAVERVSLAMHRDPVGRAGLQLQFAATRLSEIQALLAAGRDTSEAIDGLENALSGAEEEALHAVALGKDADALLAHVQEMISKHIAVLEGVLEKVPDQAKDAIEHAIENANKAKANVQKGQGKPDDVGPPSEPPGNSGNAPGNSGNAPGKSS